MMRKNVLPVLIAAAYVTLMSNACQYNSDNGTGSADTLRSGTAAVSEPVESDKGKIGAPDEKEVKREASPVDLLTDVEINGCKQKILVQTDDLNNPILLYIHGGPGDPAMMYSHMYSDLLRSKFIFVNWDQRGSGLSSYKGMDASKISEDQIFEDALEMTKYLLKTYEKEKIFILGHSFGSIIGLKLAYRHPELYHAYIGVGQVLDWNRSVVFTKKWLKGKMLEAGDDEGLKKLDNEGMPTMDMVIRYGGLTHLAIDFNSIMKASPYYFEGYIELKNGARDFVQNCIERNGSSDNLSLVDIKELKIPLYFFEGKYDHVTACAPELVVEFCNKVKAPVKEIVWFENSAHLPNLEEPLRFQQMLVEKVLGKTQ